MGRRERITVPLSEEDRLEITIEKEGGRVNGFVVNYVATVGGQDHSVVRFDTRHGSPHKDVMSRGGRVEHKDWMPTVDGHRIIDIAIDDIKGNWKTYRRRSER